MHPSDKDLITLCMEQGSDEFRRRIDRHVRDCPQCARKVVEQVKKILAEQRRADYAADETK